MSDHGVYVFSRRDTAFGHYGYVHRYLRQQIERVSQRCAERFQVSVIDADKRGVQ